MPSFLRPHATCHNLSHVGFCDWYGAGGKMHSGPGLSAVALSFVLFAKYLRLC